MPPGNTRNIFQHKPIQHDDGKVKEVAKQELCPYFLTDLSNKRTV